MEEANEKLLEALKLLIETKMDVTDEVLQNATNEQLKRYIELSDEIEAKIDVLLNK